MFSQNQRVLQFLSDTLNTEHPAWLVTLLSIWGSAPRPAGSLLAVSAAGQCGSLSGGCLEETLLEQLRQGHYARAHPHRVSFGVSQEQARQFRLPCGGEMQLLLEPIAPQSLAHQSYNEVSAALNRREPITRMVDLHSGSVQLNQDNRGCDALKISRQIHRPEQHQGIKLENDTLIHPLGPQCRLLIVGANMVADNLATLADSLEMDVWICDPRPGAFDHWPHPWTHNHTDYPDDLIREQFQDQACMIISLAHDPRIDDMALMEALNGPASYIGAMGSRRTTENRLTRLRDLGLDDAALARLRAPVGLDIGSKTPAEIAIAIAAELIAFRRACNP